MIEPCTLGFTKRRPRVTTASWRLPAPKAVAAMRVHARHIGVNRVHRRPVVAVTPAGPVAVPVSSMAVSTASTPAMAMPMPVAPVVSWGQMSGYDPLGFSLKPPKWLKKAVTLKNVLKVGAIVGAAVLIPGALPMLAKGAVGAAKLVTGGARLVGRGVVGAEKLAAKNISSAAKVFASRKGVPGTPGATDTNPPDVFGPNGAPEGGGSSSGGGGGGEYTVPGITVNATRTGVPGTPGADEQPNVNTNPEDHGGTSPTQAPNTLPTASTSSSPGDASTPEQAGTSPTSNANLLPIALGVGALLLIPTLMKKRR